MLPALLAFLLLYTCRAIAKNPDLGKNYFGVKKELLGLKINRNIVFYRKLVDRPIEITRILPE